MRSLSGQFRTVTPILLISYLIVFLTLLLVIIVATGKQIALDNFTQDPTTLMNAPFYLGAFSSIGIMFWSGSATLCFFGAYQIRYTSQHHFRFLIVSGIITLLLSFDDMFLLHEEVFPKYLNVPENAVIATYVNIFILYIILFRRPLFASEFVLLGLGFFFLGLSTVIDLLPLPLEKDSFLEDSIKLFGVVSWFIYFFRYNRLMLQNRI